MNTFDNTLPAFYLADRVHFAARLEYAKVAHSYGSSVSDSSYLHPEARCYLSGDDLAGFAVEPDGTLTSVFKLDGAGLDGKGLVRAAVYRGATTLWCFDGYLRGLYESCGFVVAGRLPWDPELAPSDWPANGGTPDVCIMHHASAVPETRSTQIINLTEAFNAS